MTPRIMPWIRDPVARAAFNNYPDNGKERRTTMGCYEWIRDAERGGGTWVADDPVVPDGDDWHMDGFAMSAGVFAWSWVRKVKSES